MIFTDQQSSILGCGVEIVQRFYESEILFFEGQRNNGSPYRAIILLFHAIQKE